MTLKQKQDRWFINYKYATGMTCENVDMFHKYLINVLISKDNDIEELKAENKKLKEKLNDPKWVVI